jgi:hypothetical protein
MTKIFLTTLCLLISTSLWSADFTQLELGLLKAISGEYSNSQGDQLNVVAETTNNVQLELFEDNSSFLDFIDMEFELSNHLYGSFYSSEGEYGISNIGFDKNNVNVLVSYDDCDNPGCTNFEVDISFTMGENNNYSIVAEGWASTHFEEPELPALDNADDYEAKYEELYRGYRYGSKQEREFFKDQLEQACVRGFGKTATVAHFDADGSDLYALYLICDYEIKSKLTKL